MLARLGRHGCGAARGAGSRPRGAIPAREQAVIDTAAEHDVPLTYSDVTGQGEAPRQLARRHAGRRHGKFREQGAQKATDAAERVVGGAKDELEQTGFRGMNRLKLAAQDGDKGRAAHPRPRSRTPATTGRRSCRPRGT
jgi:hypothetical protein